MVELDQHFLINTAVIAAAIKSAQLHKEDVVLEIGSGKGVLTSELAKHCKKVIAIEIDKNLQPDLNSLPKNVEVVYENALDVIGDLQFNKIVANIPYSISEPLLKKLLKIKLDAAVLLISDSFYALFSGESISKQDVSEQSVSGQNISGKSISGQSKWSQIVPLFFKVEKIQDVPRADFDPRPRTDSVLVKLTPHSLSSQNQQLLREIVLQDDKLVKNALMYAFMHVKNLTKNQAREKIVALKLESLLDKRVDHLSNFQFNLLQQKLV